MQESIFQLISYLRGIWRYRWYVVLLTWIVVLVGWSIVFMLPDKYTVTSRIHVDTDSILKPLLRGLTVETDISERVALMNRTLLSRPNLEKLIHMANLDLSINSTGGKEALLGKLEKDIQLSSVRVSTNNRRQSHNIYMISYHNTDPVLARDVVDSLLRILVGGTLGEQREDSEAARKFLDKQIKEYETLLTGAETRLKEFKRKNTGLMPDSGQTFFTRIGSVNTALSQSRLELREATNRRVELRRQLKEMRDAYSTDVARAVYAHHPLDERIETLRTRLDELLLQYTDQHPDVVAVKESIEVLVRRKHKDLEDSSQTISAPALESNLIYQQTQITLGEVEADIASLVVRVNEYETRLAELEKMIDVLPEIEAQLKRLDRDYEVNKGRYEALIERRESAKLSGLADTTGDEIKFRIIDPPRIPLKPSGPKRPMLASIVLFIGLAVGVGFAFILSQINPAVYNQLTLKNISGLPVFGVISRVWTDEMAMKRRIELRRFVSVVVLLIFTYGGVMYFHLFGKEYAAPLLAVMRG
ncbi:MAG: chain length-determining protein [Gammaproteobacteria bacterium]|nr:chain length-determining protein [Gammaproteobacteria bacterium]MCK5091738.1 chain length-determining protein [Gammaproteobacteria bacterium]